MKWRSLAIGRRWLCWSVEENSLGSCVARPANESVCNHTVAPADRANYAGVIVGNCGRAVRCTEGERQ